MRVFKTVFFMDLRQHNKSHIFGLIFVEKQTGIEHRAESSAFLPGDFHYLCHDAAYGFLRLFSRSANRIYGAAVEKRMIFRNSKASSEISRAYSNP